MKLSVIKAFASIEQFWKMPNNDRHSYTQKQTFSNETGHVCDSTSFGIHVDMPDNSYKRIGREQC